METRTPLIETLHKACGSVDVALDLVRRSGSLCLDAAGELDNHMAECFADATRALSVVMEALESKLLETYLGPAA